MIQCQIINYILSHKDLSFITINNIGAAFFSDYVNEFNFILEHYEKYGTVCDFQTFLVKFPDFDVIEVKETPTYLVDELYRDYNKRTLAKTFNKVRELITQDKTDEAMSYYLNAVEDMTKVKHLECVDILHDLSRYDKYIDKSKDFTKFYVKTGFKELDQLIGGWDRQEELATIAARPGVGKSWALLKIAIAGAEQGLNVGIYSGEMSELKVGYRIDTLISHISNGKIIHGSDSIQNEYKAYLDSLSDKFKGSIKVLTPRMINGIAGVNSLRAFIEKENLDMLCIDQHSLLEDDRGAKNPVERASNISKDLKNLQVMKRIPIIAVSQQNRTSTENGVDSSHIAQSDRISQDSTVIVFLEQKDNILTLHLAKARDAINNKKINYAIDLDKGIFTYIPDLDSVTSASECDNLKAEYDNIDTGENVF